jgi:choline dehydrogenase-like flavoprotein
MKTLCEMFLAAGATAVYPGILGLRESYHSMEDLHAFPHELYPSQVAMILSHLFGTTLMGPDAASAVCDPYGAVYGAQCLYVADSSLFPTNLGVNPQHTIMAMANHVAWGVLDDR